MRKTAPYACHVGSIERRNKGKKKKKKKRRQTPETLLSNTDDENSYRTRRNNFIRMERKDVSLMKVANTCLPSDLASPDLIRLLCLPFLRLSRKTKGSPPLSLGRDPTDRRTLATRFCYRTAWRRETGDDKSVDHRICVPPAFYEEKSRRTEPVIINRGEMRTRRIFSLGVGDGREICPIARKEKVSREYSRSIFIVTVLFNYG